jgi:hypothetical protein
VSDAFEEISKARALIGSGYWSNRTTNCCDWKVPVEKVRGPVVLWTIHIDERREKERGEDEP